MTKIRGVPAKSSREEHRKQIQAEQQKVISAERSKYQKQQNRAFTLLDMPQTKVAYAYHTVNLSMIFGSMIISVLSTMEHLSKDQIFSEFIFYIEAFLLTWFTVEYLVRVWSCVVVSKWKGWRGRLKFMGTFYMLVDAFVICTTFITVLLQMKKSYFIVLRITRFLQVFRVLRLDRQRGDLRTMGQVVYQHKKELITCYFVGFIILFGGSYVIYLVETNLNDSATIDNMGNGIYWAMVTVTSVGYGDIAPLTWAGKICTGIFALVGCAFFALPAGILGSGFALQVAKEKKDQRYMKVKNPAAIVIQSLWRNHAVKRGQYQLQATWVFLFPHATEDVSRTGYYGLLPGVRAIHDSESFTTFRNSLGRKKTLSRSQRRRRLPNKSKGPKRPSITSTTSANKALTESILRNVSLNSYKSTGAGDGALMMPPLSSWLGSRTSINSAIGQLSGQLQRKHRKKRDKVPMAKLISGRYKAAIQFILKVKFFTKVRYLRKARYPFVSMQDIMEKNLHNHVEAIGQLQEIDRCMDVFKLKLIC